MKIELLDERVERKKGIYADAVNNFLKTDKKTMIITCDNEEQAIQCKNTINHYKTYHDLNVVLWRDNCNVYVLKG